MRLLKLLLPKYGCPNEVLEEESARKEKSNCGNQVAEIVGEERGERKKELWQPSCRNWRKRKELWQPSCRNWGRKLEEKKKGIVEAKLPKLKKKKKIDLW